MEKSLSMDKITLGVCYYPEHWPENLWENDLDRMLEHGIEVIRIAEFAWSKFEPEEGQFTYGFFDHFLDLAHRKGMKVIFCTPTATPPAWLTHNYPEVLNAAQDGTLYNHGLRRHTNYNSKVYQNFAARIVEVLASHYGTHPAIIGWQIDNELNCEINVFYSEADHFAFRQYCIDKFRTLDAFNDAMGTVFWNQTYTSWDEVYLPRVTPNGVNNPHLVLEEKRFISHSTINFCKLQADILRKHINPNQFVTTNGIFGHLDSHEMTDKALDFITYDSYPNFAYEVNIVPHALLDQKSSHTLMKVRSISPNFGIMEQQSGAGGWDARMKQPAPKPGQMRLWTFQAIAHGADYISYFRWRTCWIGNEIYWHGLNDYSNLPNRRLEELKKIHADIRKISHIAGSRYIAKIAYLKDYDNEWDGEQDQWHGPLDRFSEDGWFTAAQKTHTPMDFVYLRRGGASLAELKKYSLVVYPHATILTEETANLLHEYIQQGGKLIMGARTGYKDEYGRCPMRPMPGFAASLCGVQVKDYTNLCAVDEPVTVLWDDAELDAPVFNDVLSTVGESKVLATFKGNYYAGEPALIENKIGEGYAYYYGAGFNAKTAAVFLKKLGVASPYSDSVILPENVELAVRRNDSHEFLFLLNYTPKTVQLEILEELEDILSGKKLSGKIAMDGYGVFVFQK